MRPWLLLPITALLLLVLEEGLQLHTRRQLSMKVAHAKARETALPSRVLWVWERPEDLRSLDPRTTGVAVLEETLRLDAAVHVVPRHQPLVIPAGISRMAVVRLETQAGFAAHQGDGVLLQAVVARLQQIARQPGIAALQIDFDARRSERGFYRRLLRALRQQMPPGLPLQITALVSWCSTDPWMTGLPVNDAVPMFFRLEPDRRRLALDASPAYRIREPLCLGSVGVSTSEPWPAETTGKRIFIFPDQGWARDLARLDQHLTPKQQARRPL